MMTMGADRCVVDTNVLIYSSVASCPHHQEARQWLAALYEQGVELCITTQILREYLVVLTHSSVFEQRFTVEQALEELKAILQTVTVLSESTASAECLLDLVRRYRVRGKQIHDANVVAVMLTQGVERLVTYNVGDFQQFKEITLEPVSAPVGE